MVTSNYIQAICKLFWREARGTKLLTGNRLAKIGQVFEVMMSHVFFQFQVTTSSGGNFRGQLSQDLWAADSDESE